MKSGLWKKLFLMILISQLTYTPCDIHTEDSTHPHKKEVKKEEPDFMNLGDKQIPAKKPVANWRTISQESLNYTGWGGTPDEISDGRHPSKGEPKDYYYLKITSRASARAIEQNSFAMMMSTCYEAAKTNGVYSIFSKFMDAVLLEYSPEEKSGTVTYNYPERGILYTCRYGRSENGLSTKECKGQMKDFGVVICGPKDGSWANCDCLSYVKFPGGKAMLSKRITYE